MQIRVMILVVFVALSGPVLALASMPAPKEGPVLFVVPPWLDRVGFLEKLGAYEIGPVPAPMAILAVLEGPEMVDRGKSFGAWAVLDGSAIARLCGYG